ncbi:MAG TPA: MFS transporter [Tenuifilaceae bacterium]|nr:MFS transporter [Tenuifilaceae bacterium]HPJ44776.1 MFS transporter [Tenuifilaceae bacterium]HPQ33289.1 MFS transporter [Tenuifilaceae bacterium]HRX67575.1 MFS transporter [Tenuifilaceae bacterium]
MSGKKTFPIFLAFLAMGFGDAVGPFVGLAKEQFALSNFEAQLIAFMGFIMFGILSVPMGIFQDRKGKKTVLMLGLVIALVGLSIPLLGLSSYALFLITILLLGAGAAILQVAGNPIMRDVSAPGKYSRNLSFGQFIKAIGSLSGSLIPFAAAKWFGADWKVLFPIYVAALLLTIVVVGLTKIKEEKSDREPANFASCLSLLNNKFILAMVLGIFIYVGIEICMSSGVPILLSSRYGIDLKTWGLLGNAFFFIAILTGRFLGSVILSWIKPSTFFKATTIFSILGVLLIFIDNQIVTIAGIFITGLGFANIFPLIFSITVDKLPERSNEISGLMVTAIAGGAFIPPIMGFIADTFTVVAGFSIPLLGLIYVTYLAFGKKL